MDAYLAQCHISAIYQGHDLKLRSLTPESI